MKVEAELEDELRKSERRKTTKALAGFGASTVLGVASIAFPALGFLSAASALYGFSAGTSLKDVVNQHLSMKKVEKDLGERPISFLLDLSQNPN